MTTGAETIKAVAYYRTRPSEPEASDTALRLQCEAVRKTLEEGLLILVAEFVEREGESASETYPAYVAAVQAAISHKKDENLTDVAFLLASSAAIGTGQPFQEPFVPGGNRLLSYLLQAPSIPIQTEIILPGGAPGPLCLLGVFRPSQLDTLVYLCNSGPEPIHNLSIVSTITELNTFSTAKRDERWPDSPNGREFLDMVSTGLGVQISRLDQYSIDFVCRYQLTFVDSGGRSWAAEAHDCSLRLTDFPESKLAWVEFSRPMLASRSQPD